jgi:hypothetical protein
MKIIEISSESDTDPEDVIPLHPLLRARARAMASRNLPTKINLEDDKTRISSECDIIDLT